LYRCSARVLVNNAISGFASMELWVFLWNSLVFVKIWWDLIAVKDCETQSNHRHACYATHSQYLYNIAEMFSLDRIVDTSVVVSRDCL
jgi:hypothetical protein